MGTLFLPLKLKKLIEGDRVLINGDIFKFLSYDRNSKMVSLERIEEDPNGQIFTCECEEICHCYDYLYETLNLWHIHSFKKLKPQK